MSASDDVDGLRVGRQGRPVDPGLADDWIVNLVDRVLEALEPSASVAPIVAPDARLLVADLLP